MRTELLALICECLEIEPAALVPETEIAGVEEWSSIGWLTIIAALDERYDYQLPMGEIRSFKTVAEFLDYLADHLDQGRSV